MRNRSRGIAKTWSVGVTRRGPGHRVGQVLPPGRWAEFDPFLMLAEDWFETGTFDVHPHRGIETVTYVIEGALGHYDNQTGEGGTLGPGDVQWMTAGRGVIHKEDPLPGQPVHSLQLWVNLPRIEKMRTPRYQNLRAEDAPVRREPGVTLRVFSGRSGDVASSTRNVVPVTMVDLHMDREASIFQDLPSTDNGFIYILQGAARFGVDNVLGKAGEVVWLGTGEDTDGVTLSAEEPLHALLFAGPPLHEPVVSYGPFVMNTRQEIEEAFHDYQTGQFI